MLQKIIEKLLAALETAAYALHEHKDEGTLPYIRKVIEEIRAKIREAEMRMKCPEWEERLEDYWWISDEGMLFCLKKCAFPTMDEETPVYDPANPPRKERIVLPRFLFRRVLRDKLDQEPTEEQVERIMDTFERDVFPANGINGGELHDYAEYLVMEWSRED